jgi:predicted transcriptional regulator
MKRNNPETSLEAYRSLKAENIREIYRKILEGLETLPEGTTEQIAAHIGLKHETIWRRFSELADMGLIYRPGHKLPLSSGRNGYVWALKRQETPLPEPKELPGKPIETYARNIQELQQATLF